MSETADLKSEEEIIERFKKIKKTVFAFLWPAVLAPEMINNTSMRPIN